MKAGPIGMAMGKTLVAALLVLMPLQSTPAAMAAEWRPWCGVPGTGAGLGWHFYCDETSNDDFEKDDSKNDASKNLSAPEKQAQQQDSEAAPVDSATAKILAMRQRLEERRAAAVLDPSAENVVAYLRLQQEALQRASAFSDAFRRAVWATPELDYTLKRPVGALAKQLWSDERRDVRDGVLAELGERYGLIYLGDAGCAGCRVFGPLLRAFALRHGLDVLAVSLTGEPLEGWPEAVPDNGRAARLGLGGVPVPAVVLFDTETGRALPVAFGVIAEDQLAERLFVLTSLEPGHDY